MNSQRRAADRRKGVQRYLWDSSKGRYLDYHWRAGQQLDRPTAAMLYPLFVGLAEPEQGRAVAAAVAATLLAPGGLLSTPQRTGQQWDAPNGWAPHQWIAVVGLNNYGANDLAANDRHPVVEHRCSNLQRDRQIAGEVRRAGSRTRRRRRVSLAGRFRLDERRDARFSRALSRGSARKRPHAKLSAGPGGSTPGKIAELRLAAFRSIVARVNRAQAPLEARMR